MELATINWAALSPGRQGTFHLSNYPATGKGLPGNHQRYLPTRRRKISLGPSPDVLIVNVEYTFSGKRGLIRK